MDVDWRRLRVRHSQTPDGAQPLFARPCQCASWVKSVICMRPTCSHSPIEEMQSRGEEEATLQELILLCLDVVGPVPTRIGDLKLPLKVVEDELVEDRLLVHIRFAPRLGLLAPFAVLVEQGRVRVDHTAGRSRQCTPSLV